MNRLSCTCIWTGTLLKNVYFPHQTRPRLCCGMKLDHRLFWNGKCAETKLRCSQLEHKGNDLKYKKEVKCWFLPKSLAERSNVIVACQQVRSLSFHPIPQQWFGSQAKLWSLDRVDKLLLVKLRALIVVVVFFSLTQVSFFIFIHLGSPCYITQFILIKKRLKYLKCYAGM